MHQAPWFQDQLLATKFFVPAANHTLIPRPRLLALLDAGLKRSLTLISAAAGYGKTTLLSAWVRSLPKGNPLLAWVSLDEEDNEPTRFWSYVFTALDNCQEGLCTSLLMLLQAQQPTSIEYLLTEFIEALSRSKKQFLLVLDDYHLISDPSISASLSFLLEHLPPQLHIHIATRTDPPFSLDALRAHDRVIEIRTTQLRTTLEEASQFLHEVMGVSFAKHEIELVETRTEGWLVGLQLIGLSQQARPTPTDLLAEVSGNHDYILDYLTEEVLRQQDEAIQSFLLRTSILQQLSAPLCDAVLEQTGSQQTLEQLEQANLFLVCLDEHRGWYRYHALFAEALRAWLERSSQEEIKGLHLRASAWYEQHSQTYEALYYALQAKAWQRAADLIESVAHTCRRSGEWRTVRRWVKQLPPAVVRARPRLCLAYALALMVVAPPETVETWLQAAEAGVTASLATQEPEHAESEPEARVELDNLLGEIFTLRALSAGYRGERHTALLLCQQALAHLADQRLATRALVAFTQYFVSVSSGDAVLATRSALQAASLAQTAGIATSAASYLASAAACLIYTGHLHEAWRHLEHAVDLSTIGDTLLLPVVGIAYTYQAALLHEWNQLDAALDLAQKALEMGERGGLRVWSDHTYSVIARIALARGDLNAASSALKHAEEVTMQLKNPFQRAMLIPDVQVRLWLALGKTARASRWAEEVLHKERQGSSMAQEREEVAMVRVLLARNRADEALTSLDPLLESAIRQARWGHVIEMRLLQAQAHRMRSEEQEAFTALAHAVQLAEPEGYIRSFVDEGDCMATLLASLRDQHHTYGPTPYMDRVLAAFS